MDKLKLFQSIINNPETILSLNLNYQTDIDFLETFYIILGEQIKPYISKEIYETLRHREIVFKNKHFKTNVKTQTNLSEEEKIFHDLLTDPKAIENVPTNEKYTNEFLEFMYIIWGDEIEPYGVSIDI